MDTAETYRAQAAGDVAEIVMLGTGSAFPQHSFNTCFVIRTDAFEWMTDTGGGNGILGRLQHAGIAAGEIRHLFISHSHTDHILGAVWIVRSVINRAKAGGTGDRLTVYGNSDVIEALLTICRLTLLESHYAMIADLITFHNTDATPRAELPGATVAFFDCGSENVRQTGFRMRFDSGRTIVCLGDEALTERNSTEAAGCQLLMCGAFCRYADRDSFKPYEKHHYTVRDVAIIAERAGIPDLLLYHCEDRDLNNRARLYTDEASAFYSGRVHVPADGDTVLFQL